MKTIALALSIAFVVPFTQVAPRKESPLARVAVIGASMSAGFGIGPSPLGGGFTIADVAQTSIRVDHTAPRSFASTLMYLNPTSYMERTMATLSQDSPSAVVALDYLFWSVHGDKSDEARRRELEVGLAGLEKLQCPILIGDIPDVTVAAKAPSPAIVASMIPSSAMRDAANTRIREWAKSHKNVTVIPLADLMKNAATRVPIRVHGNVWTEAEVPRLLQEDLLHPTAEGLIVIWIAAVDQWLASDSALEENAFDLRPRALLDAALLKLNRPAR